jgi:hypothetical protein
VERDHKEVLLLALTTEPVDLEKEPQPMAILPAPVGAANGANRSNYGENEQCRGS